MTRAEKGCYHCEPASDDPDSRSTGTAENSSFETAGTLDAVDPGDVSDALELLGDEVRMRIVIELAAAGATAPTGEPMPFSTLRKRVGVRDSGRFNYHLRRLCGPFVEDDDRGYRLTPEGAAIVVALCDAADPVTA